MYSGEKTIEWDSELLADEPGKRLAWRSTGGEVDTAGEVVFEPAPTGRGTMVTVLQEFKLGKIASIGWDALEKGFQMTYECFQAATEKTASGQH
jgi:uncharacterized membrane protein